MYRYLLILVAIVLPLAEANAFKPAPRRSHQSISADGLFVFAMLSLEPIDKELSHFRDDIQEEIRSIRDRYSKSGMYRNDGSRTPLWTVEWYADKVDVPSGGEHLVCYNDGIWHWNHRPQLAFYRRNELIRAYELSDLVAIPVTLDLGYWLASATLDDKTHTVAVTTETFDHYTFDVHTGEMTSRFRPLVYAFRLFILLALLWIWRRHRRIRQSA